MVNILQRLIAFLSRTTSIISGDKPAKSRLMPAQTKYGRIGVVISHEKNMWAAGVVQSFVTAMREQMGYQRTPEIEILSAQNSKNHLKAVMTEMYNRHKRTGEYEVIVTVGNWCSKEVRDILDAWHAPIPQIFCPATDPVQLGLVDSLEQPGRNITGVTAVLPDYDQQFDVLSSLDIKMDTILVVCDPFDDDAAMKAQVSTAHERFKVAAARVGARVQVLAIEPGRTLARKLTAALEGVDLVCTLPEPTVYACLDVLVRACNQAHVPLCTAELSSVYHGAAFGFGERGTTYGPYAAAITYDLLVNRRQLHTIPVITLKHRPYVRFNQNALAAQGVLLPQKVQHLLSMSSIFRDIA